MIDRRQFGQRFLATLVSYTLIQLVHRGEALATSLRPEMERWQATLYEICGDLKKSTLSATEWQDRIEQLHASVPLEDLLRYIDFERLIAGLEYPHDRGAIKNVTLPTIEGLGDPVRGTKIFAYRKGSATAPHAHNGMVSAHLVLDGRFHVRTFERLADEPEHLIIRPSLDMDSGRGRTVSMSDERDNVHWFLATSDHAYTLDIPLSAVYPGKEYVTPANRYGMIYLDPAGESLSDDRIRAPRLSFEQALTRYGSSHVD
jgi:hypothetical protein